MNAYMKGLGLGLSLIVAIGAQNAFVLSQAVRRNYVLMLVLCCVAFDSLAITLGVSGLGTIIAGSSVLTAVAAWGGAAFLLWYGLLSFRSALSSHRLEVSGEEVRSDWWKVLGTLLAVTFLNPHFYLDTVVLLGSIGGQFPPSQRFLFGVGAVSASTIWFFSLGFGGTLLAPFFRKPLLWRVLDVAIGCVMWTIAAGLLRGVLA